MKVEFSARGYKRTDGTLEMIGGFEINDGDVIELLLKADALKKEISRQTLIEAIPEEIPEQEEEKETEGRFWRWLARLMP